MKIKAELINLIEMMVNNGKRINKENAEECFSKLKVYQYLVDKLLEINNLDKNDILQEF